MLKLSVFVVGFFVGVVVVVGLEVAFVLFLINKLNQKNKKSEEKEAKSAAKSDGLSSSSDSSPPLDLGLNKHGVVWVLEPEKVPKNWRDKPKEQSKRKNFMVVSPVKKYAKIEDQSLILKESDGSDTSFQLRGCEVEAVSASSMSSRKWSKRYPIILRNQTSAMYKGSKTLYIYLESNWEKESWCKALRFASFEDRKKLDQFSKLQDEFHNYLKSLKEGCPAFKKPAGLYAETTDRELETKLDASSRVRLFLKKLAKKASRSGMEYKPNWTSLSGREERKTGERSLTITNSARNASIAKGIQSTIGENMTYPSSSSSQSGSQSHSSVVPDADLYDKCFIDEGTFCWNLLVSRLFFDVKGNEQIKWSIQHRIQRSLSSMRTPNYIGEVTCTDLDLGNLPPYIHSMRVLPTDMNELWALEVDIEYSGGFVLEIETRLEIRELDLQKGIVDDNREPSSIEDVSSDLIEGIEYYKRQLNLSEEKVDAQEQKDDDMAKADSSKGSKSPLSASVCVSRWKSMMNSIAKQVSEVPLSLSLRVASLRGTMQIRIKPPPSDQLWYSFISMPDIDIDLESSVGEHKIASGRIALYLVNRFKAAIRDTLVHPNCESLCIPWMLAEKDDWVPRETAPFIWLNQEPASDSTTMREKPNSKPSKLETTVETGKESPNGDRRGKCTKSNEEPVRHSPIESTETISHSSSSNSISTQSSNALHELQEPLLGNNERPESSQRQIESPGCRSPQRYVSLSEKRSIGIEDGDTKTKRMGTRAKMFDLGKKMGEKLEEKRRHIEEKSKSIVDRMRGS